MICCAILACSLSGCSYEFLPGKYAARRGIHHFHFRPDSTFTYEFSGGCYKEATGNWREDGQRLYVSSLGQVDRIPVTYQKREGTKPGVSVMNVTVNMPKEEVSNYVCFPVLNKEKPYFPKTRGSFSFGHKERIDSLVFAISKIPFSGGGFDLRACFQRVLSETIYPQAAIGDTLDVQVNIIDSLFSYQVFKNEPMKIGRKSLVFRYEGKKYRLHLKKTR
jgi:hypothetical protein